MPNYIDEFRDSKAAKILVQRLQEYDGDEIKIMEVCGTHTMAIARFGIRSILSKNIKLLSGPGCPICVTPSSYIKLALELSKSKELIILTFGDMMRIQVDGESLLHMKAKGADVRVIYSPLDSLKVAEENKNKEVVLLSIGFETTTPIIALTVTKSKEMKLNNFYVLTANKTIPNALKMLASDQEIGINSLLYPGHVSAVIGTWIYENILRDYGVSGAVTGFEPLDILLSIDFCVNNHKIKNKTFKNLYKRVVKDGGNKKAMEIMEKVFRPCDAVWRGLGTIPLSGLELRDDYIKYDAWKKYGLEMEVLEEPKDCICGEILKGKKLPEECLLFGKKCTPKNPVGACMVSSEGSCAAYYKYRGITR